MRPEAQSPRCAQDAETQLTNPHQLLPAIDIFNLHDAQGLVDLGYFIQQSLIGQASCLFHDVLSCSPVLWRDIRLRHEECVWLGYDIHQPAGTWSILGPALEEQIFIDTSPDAFSPTNVELCQEGQAEMPYKSANTRSFTSLHLVSVQG